MTYRKALLFFTTLFLFTINALSCDNPAVAEDNLTKTFRYGCFCGEEYPKIEHPSKINYRELNSTARKELIKQYREIEPYDDIDRVCQEHDICFIAHGKKAKECNDAIYKSLNELEDKFRRYEEENLTNEQCKNLAFDIGSVFNTIFSPSDDEDTIFDFGMFMVNGAITVTNKMGQEIADSLIDNGQRYPPKGVRCLVKKESVASTTTSP